MRLLSINSLLFVLVLTALLASCEKEVHIDLGTSPTQVVVQGAVESGQPPYVLLTSTIGFFNKVDLTTLQNSFLHDAVITVSDGSNTVALKEYAFDTGSASKFYIYSIDTSAASTGIMLGEVGKFYTLSITYDGKVYTAVTKIPQPKPIDSMWFDEPIFKGGNTPDSAKQLFANYTDPDSLGNSVRCYTQRNTGQFFPTDLFNDEVVNGKPITNIPLSAGFDNSQNANRDSLRYFYPGETVTLKWSAIDKYVYRFWNSYGYALNAVGNPFASPINLQTNMTNGALGVWAGYGSVYTTLVVP